MFRDWLCNRQQWDFYPVVNLVVMRRHELRGGVGGNCTTRASLFCGELGEVGSCLKCHRETFLHNSNALILERMNANNCYLMRAAHLAEDIAGTKWRYM